MRRLLYIVLLSVALPLIAQDDSKKEEFEKRVRELIKELGAEEWHDRERATKELIKLGNVVGRYLEEALKSEDAEVRMRAERIIDEIGYVPDELCKKLTELCEKLKSNDFYVQKKVLKEMQGYGRAAGRFLRKFFKNFERVKLKAKMEFNSKIVYLRTSYKVKLVVRNESDKPCWLNVHDIRYIRVTVKTEEGGTASQYASFWPRKVIPLIVYLPPNTEKNFSYRMYVPRCGKVTISARYRIIETYGPHGSPEVFYLKYPDGSTEGIPVPTAEIEEAEKSGILALTPPNGITVRNPHVIGGQGVPYSLTAELKRTAHPSEKLTLKAIVRGFQREGELEDIEKRWNKDYCFSAIYLLKGEKVVAKEVTRSFHINKKRKEIVFTKEFTAPEEEGRYRVVVYASTSYRIFGDIGAPHFTLEITKQTAKEKSSEF